MKFVKLLKLPLICLLFSLQLEAQQYSMRHFSVNEGLVQSDVNKIIQDKKKYIWIATNGGISRFDGLKIKNYKIPISQIAYDAVEGDKNNLFVLMNKGVGMIRNDSIYSFRFSPEMELEKCRNLAFCNEKLWMITNCGITSFDGKNFRVTTTIKDVGINAIWFTIDSQNVIWIEDSRHDIWYVEKNIIKRFSVEGKAIRIGKEMGVKKDGKFYQLIGKNLSLLDFSYQDEPDCLIKNKDFWYFSVNNQIYRKKGNINDLLFESSENDKIRTMLIDKENKLWVGTHNGFYYSNSLAFTKYIVPGKLDNQVWGVLEDNNKNMWFTSFGNGLTKYDGREFQRIESYKTIMNTDSFYIGSIKKSDGVLLFSTIKGVLQYDGKRFSKVHGLPDQIYLHIYEDVGGKSMFYAGEKSLVIVAKDSIKIYDNLKYGLPHIFNIFKDKDSIYRMGGAESTVFYDGKKFLSPDTTRFKYTGGMYSSVIDSRGNVWFATRYGIKHYDYKTCQTVLPTAIGEVVLDLKMYLGRIYFGTIKGVGLIDTAEYYKKGKSVLYFDWNNGYPGEEVVQNAAFIASDSDIWIPASRGVTRFRPSRIKSVTHMPPIQIESLRIMNPGDSVTVIPGYALNKNSRLKLSYSKRDIEIRYHCVFFSDPEGISYKYRLENYDKTWRKASYTTRSIKYTQLPAGNYTFKINAYSRDGATATATAIISFTIARPFWQQWWFLALALLIFIFLTSLLNRSFKRKARKKAEIQQQLLKLKADALAAQMNPHFVFNCISSINALINLGDKQAATLYLGRFATLLRSVLKNVRANEISLEEELQMVENYMQLEQARYSNPFSYTIKRPEGVSSTQVMIPPLIIHPFVENSILHGFKGVTNVEKRINILALLSGEFLKVVVNDNGSGIKLDKEMAGTGFGLKITNERIALLESNSEVKIESDCSEDHHGTTITISIPLKLKKTQND